LLLPLPLPLLPLPLSLSLPFFFVHLHFFVRLFFFFSGITNAEEFELSEVIDSGVDIGLSEGIGVDIKLNEDNGASLVDDISLSEGIELGVGSLGKGIELDVGSLGKGIELGVSSSDKGIELGDGSSDKGIELGDGSSDKGIELGDPVFSIGGVSKTGVFADFVLSLKSVFVSLSIYIIYLEKIILFCFVIRSLKFFYIFAKYFGINFI
jgi:hypothetical protein